MMTIRVAIVRSRDDVLSELIQRECQASLHLDLVAVELFEREGCLNQRLEIAGEAEVLIAIGDYTAENLKSIIEHKTGSVFSSILVGSESVSMHLKQVGAQQLIDTQVALSNQRDREYSRLIKYEVVSNADATRGFY